ncbi:DUF5666 domain-containing protein [Rhizobium sp. CSW-27]|uniref:DUF5666 domain-containing protein n=1 Tax=Rhizobium sp. CSW-27 TaxID=2839985 RepID=UPI001C02A392|nr:DUF5666 domain-containing protein [Rhizobium sp. CSW-27]MBT9369652.1 hypothetical protein [Rhizobium sp. CSW-27]
MKARLSRRLFLHLAASLPLLAANAWAAPRKVPSSDHGIGGTGLSVSGGGEGDDHGIGGTGIVGTLQRFGSIYVNDLRIRYPDDVPVFIDGRRQTAEALRIGHVVRAILSGTDKGPVTGRIDVTSEVIGRIESVEPGAMTVLSQRIDTTGATGLRNFRTGQMVAVFGIRKPDATIVASRIEPRPKGAVLTVRGVAAPEQTRMRLGGLLITRPAGRLQGRRVIMTLTQRQDGLHLRSLEAETLVPGLTSGRVNVETYAEANGRSLRLGIGIDLPEPAGRPAPQGPQRTYFDAVLDGRGQVSPSREGDDRGARGTRPDRRLQPGSDARERNFSPPDRFDQPDRPDPPSPPSSPDDPDPSAQP